MSNFLGVHTTRHQMAGDGNEVTADAGTNDRRVDGNRNLQTLGTVQLRDHETNELILIPTPSDDPNDPLNWYAEDESQARFLTSQLTPPRSQVYKYYMAVVICLAMMMCNFLAAGPSIAILQTALDFFPGAPLETAISRIAYFFTTASLLQGVGLLVWVPLTNKFGRRPVYITSYALYFACAIWLIFEGSYNGFLVGRVLLGSSAGAAEAVAPISITDVFFLHERGFVMALYTSFLSVGVALGIIVDGLIVINHNWRVIYEVAAALIGFVLLLAFFTFPETAYIRKKVDAAEFTHRSWQKNANISTVDVEQPCPDHQQPPQKESYLKSLRIYHKVWTEESLLKMMVRPLGLICLPPVLWSALVQSVTVGFLVAVTTNVANAYTATYGFEPWQIGLCFTAAVLGSLAGIPAGGQLSDATANWLTKRNGGLRIPEMRLPAMTVCLISTPLGLLLYGVGIEKKLHWICPTIGLGLLNFSISQGTNVCLTYAIDAYRPIAGEVTLTVMGFKSLFGFLLSFYTNPWVAQAGYINAYGAMAGIAAFVLILWVPLYIWGKDIRHRTLNWPVISYIQWDNDREVGE